MPQRAAVLIDSDSHPIDRQFGDGSRFGSRPICDACALGADDWPAVPGAAVVPGIPFGRGGRSPALLKGPDVLGGLAWPEGAGMPDAPVVPLCGRPPGKGIGLSEAADV